MTSPGQFFKDYTFDLPDQTQQELMITSRDEVDVLVIVTVPAKEPRSLTANLLGPLIINVRKRLACQIVLDPNLYPVQCPLIPETQT